MRLFLQRLGSAFAYTTVRQVKVHSVTVGLLYLTLVVAISAYVVGYEFFLGESKVAAAEAEEGAGRLTRGLGAQWPRRARQKRTANRSGGGGEGGSAKKKSSRDWPPAQGQRLARLDGRCLCPSGRVLVCNTARDAERREPWPLAQRCRSGLPWVPRVPACFSLSLSP